MLSITTGMFFPSLFKVTDDILVTILSFCISLAKYLSMLNSANSHSIPIVIEKQIDTMQTNIGDRFTCTYLLLLSKSTNEKPIAAQMKPFMV